MMVSPQERVSFIPFIYGAKYDDTTGNWVAPSGALLTVCTLFPNIVAEDNVTEAILKVAKAKLQIMSKIKKDLTNKEVEFKSKDYKFLMKHQEACNRLSKERPRYAFFLDTGTR